jgi:hypothetical protein
MYPIEVTPLAPTDAEELARRLIAGEELAASNFPRSAAAIAEAADYVPFYIHHIARCLKLTGRDAEPDQVADAVSEQLVDANDPWQLRHYRERISTYYPHDEPVVILLLDALSVADVPRSVAVLLTELKSQSQFDDRDQLLDLLRRMERDHYVRRTPEGTYQFRFPLIRRWWRLDRGL